VREGQRVLLSMWVRKLSERERSTISYNPQWDLVTSESVKESVHVYTEGRERGERSEISSTVSGNVSLRSQEGKGHGRQPKNQISRGEMMVVAGGEPIYYT
jgi:hypothetical protein